MWTFNFVLLGTTLALPAGRAEEPKSNAAVDALAGIWKLEEAIIDGEPQALPPRPPRWVIRGDKVVYAGKPLATMVIDATTIPPSIDLAFLKPKRTCEGIYSLKDDTLKICVSRATDGIKERPLSFATKGKPELRLLVFKRLKEAGADAIEHLGGFAGIVIGYNKAKELTVVNVIDGTPAQKAGLKKDDVLLKVGAEDAGDLRATVSMFAQARPGTDLNVRVRRAGKEQDFKVKIGVAPFFLLD
jgi:uncharacterized protein (TIGR03067 family)